MRVTIIIAGMSELSNSAALASAFATGMSDAGADVTELRLKQLRIDHFDVAKHYGPSPERSDDVSMIERAIASSDGVVIATPIWNFSIPGHLKNLIDRLGASCLDAETHSRGLLKGKPFFLIFTGGMPRSGWTGLLSLTTSHVQEAIRYFGGSTVGIHYEGRTTPARGTFGLVVDKRTSSLSELTQKGTAFAAIVDRYARTGTLPLKHEMANRVLRFGYALVQKLVYTFS